MLLQKLVCRSGIQLATKKLFQSREIDGKGKQAAPDQALDFVSGRDPVGKSRKVLQERVVVGPEIVWPVVVDTDPGGVRRIVAVAGNVRALIDYQYLPSQHTSTALGQHAPDGTSPANQ